MHNNAKLIEKIETLPWWGEKVTVAPLEGGITNHNFLVTRTSDELSRYVVRLGDDIPVHHITRRNEVIVSQAAHAAGLSPQICYHESGMLVMDYVESRTLTPTDVAAQQTLERILPVVKRCHLSMPEYVRGAPVAYWVFHVIRDYITTLHEGNSTHQSVLSSLLQACEKLERLAAPFDIVFCHNDLLSANFLDDGNKIWLIDWEYAGYNTPLFDLGGIASNNNLSESQERWLLQQYFDNEVSDNLWLRYQAMKTASLLRETLWSMVSEIHSTIDFDYSVYSQENLDSFNASWRVLQEMQR